MQSTDDEVIELINKKYYVDAAKTMVNYNQEYKNQLNRLLLNSSVINAQRINSTLFIKSKIKSLIKDYNESIDGKQPVYEHKEEKMSVSFGIIAGGNSTALKFKGSYPEFNQLQFDNSQGINAGLKVDLTFPKTRKKWSLYNELLFSNYNFISKDYYSIYLNEKSYDIANYRFKASYLKLVNAFRFKLPYTIAPFFQFGVANGFALHHSGTKLTQHTFNGVTTSYVTPFYSYRIYEQSILADVGIDYKKMGVEFRYEKGNGMSGIEDISSKLNYMYILLNYSF